MCTCVYVYTIYIYNMFTLYLWLDCAGESYTSPPPRWFVCLHRLHAHTDSPVYEYRLPKYINMVYIGTIHICIYTFLLACLFPSSSCSRLVLRGIFVSFFRLRFQAPTAALYSFLPPPLPRWPYVVDDREKCFSKYMRLPTDPYVPSSLGDGSSPLPPPMYVVGKEPTPKDKLDSLHLKMV